MKPELVTPDADGTMRFPDGSALKLGEGDRPPRGYGCNITSCDCQPYDETAECNECGLPAPNHTIECRTGHDLAMEKEWKEEVHRVSSPKPRPMRIRVLTLPAEIHANQPPSKPFIIIVDRAAVDPETITPLQLAIKTQTGARGVLIFDEEVEIGDDQ